MSFSAAVNLYTVALAVDRVLALLIPFWHRDLNKAKLAGRLSVAITTAALAIPLSEIQVRVYDPSTSTCSFKPGHPTFGVVVFLIAIMFVFPIGALVISNIIFVWALRKRVKPSQPNQTLSDVARSQENQRRHNEDNFVLMLLVTTRSSSYQPGPLFRKQ